MRANLVTTATDWQWSSLGESGRRAGLLDDWPVPRPPQWLAYVNRPETEKELAALRRALKRGCPYGNEQWMLETAKALGLEASLRPRGRPRKQARTAK